ncbi:response regulator [Aquirufa nivalisilvae]|uniref:response regulator n=1 Tax=Aquirufa nivalisilvae TaxID=2516557 RepID=UPI0022A9C60F|nr:response regulator [Aquirufa nivalisilvae]
MMNKILLIEDSDDIRENTAELLELSGYVVETAADGIEGVRMAQQNLPDLVICDIMMPHLDGFGVLQVFSNHEYLSKVPFIFLTAKTDRSDMRKGMEMGADDFLTKPFQEVELLRSIETRLKKKSLQRTEGFVDAELQTEVSLAQKALDFLDFTHFDGEKRTHHVQKKQSIYTEGDSPSRLFFLEKGKIKTYHTNREGKYFITSFIKEGEFFGYVDILENQIYRETAEALEESVVLSISSNEFKDLLKQNIHLEIYFRKALTSYLMKNEKILVSMAYQSLRIRVSMALVELAKTYGKDVNGPVVIRLSREDLASRVGTATETVIRTLSDFKKEGLLEIRGSEMTLLDVNKLANLRY